MLLVVLFLLENLNAILIYLLLFFYARYIKWVRLFLQVIVGGLMSYLRYMCLFVHSSVQHILC